ncbi:efflux RND transporter periplasmic adaptor subunit [Tahibacter soli]|uniref:Efflux RND transporter periplasmic adaptor subunit n=1 Tax=Tahibacter soli TaxID=2983605 RepID=A0A9X3YR06_9GAMM|nr:efflux RND transporter periplasmic adaptor subunit [Tahibacter soli]MDC8015920.1 efflux RND transporter periplasmic adaptor subunit [Tahibacter soli]
MSPDSTVTASAASHRGLKVTGIAAAVVAALVVFAGVSSRASGNARLKEWTDAQAVPSVSVVAPVSGGDASTLALPGRIEAYARAPIHARVSGYLKSWKVDIGTPVKAGQLLAEIEAPDVEQQLLQAKADLASAEANAALAATTAKRWQSMLGSDSVSQQEVDEKNGDLDAKRALAKAARANVERLQATENFTRIVAPFDGVITARETDVGALINGAGTGAELFVVSDTSRLRVYVNLPQSYAASIRPGATASIDVPERAGTRYEAKVEAFSQAVNAATGTTLVQLSVDNPNGELMPGGYANVSFALPHDGDALRIPASALIFDQGGLRVATVDGDKKVVFKPITIARDMGKTIEVATGLAAADRIIETPPDGVAAGDVVHIVEAAAPKAAPQKPAVAEANK